ncbi:MAG TPA: DUF1730 domain-containing protein, partial [Phaeodactylibacter sp.]|nr:DUF1730 domain-containing protein [Phaeodactylibacter sp.]
MNSRTRTQLIKEAAYRLGFDFVGVAKAEKMDEESRRLEAWLNKGMHGKMQYMENYFEKRTDPTKLVEGAKSVVTLMYNYFPKEKQPETGTLKIAKYAYGKDYHPIIRHKLKALLQIINEEIGEVHGRCF